MAVLDASEIVNVVVYVNAYAKPHLEKRDIGDGAFHYAVADAGLLVVHVVIGQK